MRETGRKPRTHGFRPVPTPSSRLWKTLLFHVENPHCAAWGSVGKWVSATSHAEGAFRRRAVWHARPSGTQGRLAQRERRCLTSTRSGVQIPPRPPEESGEPQPWGSFHVRAPSERFSRDAGTVCGRSPATLERFGGGFGRCGVGARRVSSANLPRHFYGFGNA